MVWYKIVSLASLAICLISSSYHLARLIRLGNPKDFSHKAGNTKLAIRYSFTGAMNPTKKESAFLHLPTYTAGIIYHLGTFLSIALFFLILFNVSFHATLNKVIALMLAISSISGFGILVKRIVIKKLRNLSNIDDYISNFLVTIFQAVSAFALWGISIEAVYFITSTALLLYLPIGKLKHAIYFFAARYHLGFFYGWRGVWPPTKHKPA
jgi:nitrate reductase gamma subunit